MPHCKTHQNLFAIKSVFFVHKVNNKAKKEQLSTVDVFPRLGHLVRRIKVSVCRGMHISRQVLSGLTMTNFRKCLTIELLMTEEESLKCDNHFLFF